MVRLLLEDVTLIRDGSLTMHIRVKGGALRTIQLPLPLQSWQHWQTRAEIVTAVDGLLDRHTYPEIAEILNEQGLHSGKGRPLTARLVANIQRSNRLTPRYDRLRKAGMLTVAEMAKLLGIRKETVRVWKRCGLIRGHPYNGKNDCLYESPGDNPPRKAQGVKLSKRAVASELVTQCAKEVQCEA